MSWKDSYPPLRQPDRTLRTMTQGDIPAAIALTESVQWTHLPADWERLLYWSPDGCFVIEEAERGLIGTVSTTPYGTALGWIGMVIVAPDRQRQGLGRQLLRAALDFLIERDTQRIMLDATGAGRALYERMGFRPAVRIERWEGRASTYLGPRARPLREEDRSAVFELDAVLFSLKRTHILARLLDEFPGLSWVDYEQERLEGYLLGRRTQTGITLGPWMTWSAASAERLLLAALEQLQGQHISLNIPDSSGRGLVLVSDHNFRRVGHSTRMIYGSATPIPSDPLAQLAVVSLATG